MFSPAGSAGACAAGGEGPGPRGHGGRGYQADVSAGAVSELGAAFADLAGGLSDGADLGGTGGARSGEGGTIRAIFGDRGGADGMFWGPGAPVVFRAVLNLICRGRCICRSGEEGRYGENAAGL